ncbi:MAG: prevent-host-death protein [Pyrinomonadaceae bacterium]
MTEVQYISDSNGKAVGVIVPIELWEEMESREVKPRAAKLKNLFKITQALPQIRTVTDDEILREIKAYRNGK